MFLLFYRRCLQQKKMNSTLTNSTPFGDSEDILVLCTVLRSSLGIQISLGFFLYTYIIVLFLSKGGGKEVSLVFALNHAVSEILYSMTSLLYLFLFENTSSSVIQLLYFLFVISMSARVLFLCCMSFEQYLAVVHPVTFLRFKPLRYRVACSVLGWMIVLVLGTIASTILNPYAVLVAVYIVSWAVKIYCCTSVLRTLRRPGPGDVEREQAEMSAPRKKAFQIVSVNLLTCLIQNIPAAVSYSLEYNLSVYNFQMATVICTAISVFTGFVQPVFILHRAGKLSFRKCSCTDSLNLII